MNYAVVSMREMVGVVAVEDLLEHYVVDCSMPKSSYCLVALRRTPFRMVCLCVTVLMSVKCLS